jgi:16S rRNA (cytosine967-C5)-methyltransferase
LTRIEPRRAAWEFLRDAERDDSYINLAIENLYRKVDPKERPFVTELVFGSVRMRGFIDHVIETLCYREVDDSIRSILRMALYEALLMRTADHAVVNEYVEIAKNVIGKSRSGFINAVMRRAVRERDALVGMEDLDLETRSSHPQWIVDAYGSLLSGEELERELFSHNLAGEVTLVSFDTLDPKMGIPSELTPFGYRSLQPPGEIAEIRESRVFVQDEGSQVLCEIALSTDKERVLKWLDLCAGPGGKFAYLAGSLTPEHLIGNELHPHRAELIRKRKPEHRVLVGDGTKFAGDELFDRIVIDAPCTGIGSLRRRPDARWRRTETDLKELVPLQRNLLNRAAEILAPGGIIFYMTCSPHPLETDAQISEFLGNHPDFKIEPISREHVTTLKDDRLLQSVKQNGSLQLLTKDFGTDAMFLAMLRKRVLT